MFKPLKRLPPQARSPVVIAVALAVLLSIWLVSGEKRSAKDQPPAAQAKPEQAVPTVQTQWMNAEPLQREHVVQGQLLPWQQVDVKAQVSGRVEKLIARQGDKLAAGSPLLLLSDEGRTEQLKEAQADYRLRKRELENARALESPKFVTETELIRLEGELARAEAEVIAAELAVQYNQPGAPFDGVVNRRYVDKGELVQPGEPLMSVVDIDRLKVTAQIPQQEASGISEGQEVIVTLLDGRELSGEVKFVSYAADASTRSFYVEVEVANPERQRVAGASATLRIQLPMVLAHRLSPALLKLDEQGRLGAYAVDGSGQVVYHPVKVVSISTDAATVTGLPEQVQVITRGAGFVDPGERVKTQSPQTRGAAE